MYSVRYVCYSQSVSVYINHAQNIPHARGGLIAIKCDNAHTYTIWKSMLAVVITPRETVNGPVHLVVTPDALRGISCATR